MQTNLKSTPCHGKQPPVDMSVTPDAELAQWVTRRDRKAEAELCRRFRPRTFGFLQRQAKSVAQAEDLTQETLMVVLLTLREGKLSDPDKLAGYVRQTAKNLLIIDLRKSRRRENLLQANSATMDVVEEDQALADIARARARDSLRLALTNLRVARDREILIQHYLLEMGRPSICQNMEIDRDQFDRIISRARQRARKFLGVEQRELLAC